MSFQLKGNASITIPIGTTYVDEGTQNGGGNAVLVRNTVNVNKTGTYFVEYAIVRDASPIDPSDTGAKYDEVVTRTVVVADHAPSVDPTVTITQTAAAAAANAEDVLPVANAAYDSVAITDDSSGATINGSTAKFDLGQYSVVYTKTVDGVAYTATQSIYVIGATSSDVYLDDIGIAYDGNAAFPNTAIRSIVSDASKRADSDSDNSEANPARIEIGGGAYNGLAVDNHMGPYENYQESMRVFGFYRPSIVQESGFQLTLRTAWGSIPPPTSSSSLLATWNTAMDGAGGIIKVQYFGDSPTTSPNAREIKLGYIQIVDSTPKLVGDPLVRVERSMGQAYTDAGATPRTTNTSLSATANTVDMKFPGTYKVEYTDGLPGQLQKTVRRTVIVVQTLFKANNWNMVQGDLLRSLIEEAVMKWEDDVSKCFEISAGNAYTLVTTPGGVDSNRTYWLRTVRDVALDKRVANFDVEPLYDPMDKNSLENERRVEQFRSYLDIPTEALVVARVKKVLANESSVIRTAPVQVANNDNFGNRYTDLDPLRAHNNANMRASGFRQFRNTVYIGSHADEARDNSQIQWAAEKRLGGSTNHIMPVSNFIGQDVDYMSGGVELKINGNITCTGYVAENRGEGRIGSARLTQMVRAIDDLTNGNMAEELEKVLGFMGKVDNIKDILGNMNDGNGDIDSLGFYRDLGTLGLVPPYQNSSVTVDNVRNFMHNLHASVFEIRDMLVYLHTHTGAPQLIERFKEKINFFQRIKDNLDMFDLIAVIEEYLKKLNEAKFSNGVSPLGMVRDTIKEYCNENATWCLSWDDGGSGIPYQLPEFVDNDGLQAYSCVAEVRHVFDMTTKHEGKPVSIFPTETNGAAFFTPAAATSPARMYGLFYTDDISVPSTGNIKSALEHRTLWSTGASSGWVSRATLINDIAKDVLVDNNSLFVSNYVALPLKRGKKRTELPSSTRVWTPEATEPTAYTFATMADLLDFFLFQNTRLVDIEKPESVDADPMYYRGFQPRFATSDLQKGWYRIFYCAPEAISSTSLPDPYINDGENVSAERVSGKYIAGNKIEVLREADLPNLYAVPVSNPLWSNDSTTMVSVDDPVWVPNESIDASQIYRFGSLNDVVTFCTPFKTMYEMANARIALFTVDKMTPRKAKDETVFWNTMSQIMVRKVAELEDSTISDEADMARIPQALVSASNVTNDALHLTLLAPFVSMETAFNTLKHVLLNMPADQRLNIATVLSTSISAPNHIMNSLVKDVVLSNLPDEVRKYRRITSGINRLMSLVNERGDNNNYEMDLRKAFEVVVDRLELDNEDGFLRKMIADVPQKLKDYPLLVVGRSIQGFRVAASVVVDILMDFLGDNTARVGFELVLEAICTIVNLFPGVDVNSNKVSKTIRGAFVDVSDAVTGVIETVVGPLSPYYKVEGMGSRLDLVPDKLRIGIEQDKPNRVPLLLHEDPYRDIVGRSAAQFKFKTQFTKFFGELLLKEKPYPGSTTYTDYTSAELVLATRFITSGSSCRRIVATNPATVNMATLPADKQVNKFTESLTLTVHGAGVDGADLVAPRWKLLLRERDATQTTMPLDRGWVPVTQQTNNWGWQQPDGTRYTIREDDSSTIGSWVSAGSSFGVYPTIRVVDGNGVATVTSRIVSHRYTPSAIETKTTKTTELKLASGDTVELGSGDSVYAHYDYNYPTAAGSFEYLRDLDDPVLEMHCGKVGTFDASLGNYGGICYVTPSGEMSKIALQEPTTTDHVDWFSFTHAHCTFSGQYDVLGDVDEPETQGGLNTYLGGFLYVDVVKDYARGDVVHEWVHYSHATDTDFGKVDVSHDADEYAVEFLLPDGNTYQLFSKGAIPPTETAERIQQLYPDSAYEHNNLPGHTETDPLPIQHPLYFVEKDTIDTRNHRYDNDYTERIRSTLGLSQDQTIDKKFKESKYGNWLEVNGNNNRRRGEVVQISYLKVSDWEAFGGRPMVRYRTKKHVEAHRYRLGETRPFRGYLKSFRQPDLSGSEYVLSIMEEPTPLLKYLSAKIDSSGDFVDPPKESAKYRIGDTKLWRDETYGALDPTEDTLILQFPYYFDANGQRKRNKRDARGWVPLEKIEAVETGTTVVYPLQYTWTVAAGTGLPEEVGTFYLEQDTGSREAPWLRGAYSNPDYTGDDEDGTSAEPEFIAAKGTYIRSGDGKRTGDHKSNTDGNGNFVDNFDIVVEETDGTLRVLDPSAPDGIEVLRTKVENGWTPVQKVDSNGSVSFPLPTGDTFRYLLPGQGTSYDATTTTQREVTGFIGGGQYTIRIPNANNITVSSGTSIDAGAFAETGWPYVTWSSSGDDVYAAPLFDYDYTGLTVRAPGGETLTLSRSGSEQPYTVYPYVQLVDFKQDMTTTPYHWQYSDASGVSQTYKVDTDDQPVGDTPVSGGKPIVSWITSDGDHYVGLLAAHGLSGITIAPFSWSCTTTTAAVVSATGNLLTLVRSASAPTVHVHYPDQNRRITLPSQSREEKATPGHHSFLPDQHWDLYGGRPEVYEKSTGQFLGYLKGVAYDSGSSKALLNMQADATSTSYSESDPIRAVPVGDCQVRFPHAVFDADDEELEYRIQERTEPVRLPIRLRPNDTVTVRVEVTDGVFWLDDIRQKALEMVEGSVYRFDQSHSSNGGFELQFYTDAARATPYAAMSEADYDAIGAASKVHMTQHCVVNGSGTTGAANAYTEVRVAFSGPPLYYDVTPSVSATRMGAAAQIYTHPKLSVNSIRYDHHPEYMHGTDDNEIANLVVEMGRTPYLITSRRVQELEEYQTGDQTYVHTDRGKRDVVDDFLHLVLDGQIRNEITHPELRIRTSYSYQNSDYGNNTTEDILEKAQTLLVEQTRWQGGLAESVHTSYSTPGSLIAGKFYQLPRKMARRTKAIVVNKTDGTRVHLNAKKGFKEHMVLFVPDNAFDPKTGRIVNSPFICTAHKGSLAREFLKGGPPHSDDSRGDTNTRFNSDGVLIDDIAQLRSNDLDMGRVRINNIPDVDTVSQRFRGFTIRTDDADTTNYNGVINTKWFEADALSRNAWSMYKYGEDGGWLYQCVRIVDTKNGEDAVNSVQFYIDEEPAVQYVEYRDALKKNGKEFQFGGAKSWDGKKTELKEDTAVQFKKKLEDTTWHEGVVKKLEPSFAMNLQSLLDSFEKWFGDGIGGFFDQLFKSICDLVEDIFGDFTNIFFTGQHACATGNAELFKSEYMGRVVVVTGEFRTMMNGDLSEGAGAVTVNNSWPVVELSSAYKQKGVFGVIGGTHHLGGEESEMEAGRNWLRVNQCGEGAVFVDDTHGDIELGDFLVTSAEPGYATRQDDDIQRSCTLAKANMAVKFDEYAGVQSYMKDDGTTVRYALVGCTYRC